MIDFITIIVFFLADIFLAGILLTYLFAFKLRRSISILSIAFFVCSVLLSNTISTISALLNYYAEEPVYLSWQIFIALPILLTSVFFLYTSWKEK